MRLEFRNIIHEIICWLILLLFRFKQKINVGKIPRTNFPMSSLFHQVFPMLWNHFVFFSFVFKLNLNIYFNPPLFWHTLPIAIVLNSTQLIFDDIIFITVPVLYLSIQSSKIANVILWYMYLLPDCCNQLSTLNVSLANSCV